MITILVFIGICLTIIALGVRDTYRYHKDFREGDPDGVAISLGISIVILLMTVALPIVISYCSYLNVRTFYDRVQNDYKEAIEVYEDKAVIDSEALTDFKYQGYQENLATLIKDLREKTVWYNELMIKKRLVRENVFFGWYIVRPDEDMKLLRVKE